MNDLFVLTADADAQALFESVLKRNRDLGVRPISARVQRFPGRDSGMVKEGPEIARALVAKTEYSRLVLVWDLHGSGWEGIGGESSVDRIQQRLDGVTFTDRSTAVVAVPELEEWLWYCRDSLAGHLGMAAEQFEAEVARVANTKFGRQPEQCCREAPKELFEALFYQRMRRQPLPEDFKRIAARADLTNWENSATFARLVRILRDWFPV
jgi:hypothetical protein